MPIVNRKLKIVHTLTVLTAGQKLNVRHGQILFVNAPRLLQKNMSTMPSTFSCCSTELSTQIALLLLQGRVVVWRGGRRGGRLLGRGVREEEEQAGSGGMGEEEEEGSKVE